MTGVRKHYYCRQFVRLLNGSRNAEPFSRKLSASLSRQTLPAEHDLVRHLPRVLRITRSFSEPQRNAVQRCLRIMAEGMGHFQLRADKKGLDSVEELDRYCYYVAGVVGEMLSQLFCLHSAAVSKNHDALMALSISFGQGLQMTNILKDLWEDYRLGACWLPREIFAQEGFDLTDLTTGRNRQAFERGIRRLIAIAHGHLKNALAYTLLVPKHETGIRKFCLWAIGMALLTLRKIDSHLDYTDGSKVKISRLSVKATVLFTGLAVKHDALLKALFLISVWRLPLTFPVTRWHGIDAADRHSPRAV
jgi:farnesyl-diphosphate farnesyltransferase